MRTKKDFDHQNEYNRQKYDRVQLMIPKGNADIWKEEARRNGKSLNAFVQEAVNFYTEHLNLCKIENDNKKEP